MNKIKQPSKDFRAETVILANGEFPKAELALSVLRNTGFLVCCDGATNQLTDKTNLIPHAIVGDFDSVSEENMERFANILYHVAEQNTNDLTKAVNLCRSLGKKDITFLGATGRREDHALANISLLARYIDDQDSSFRIITDYGMFVAIQNDTEFESFVGQQVSLFNLSTTAVTTTNLKYPLEKYVLPELWAGTLNESLAANFSLQVDGKMIVFLEF